MPTMTQAGYKPPEMPSPKAPKQQPPKKKLPKQQMPTKKKKTGKKYSKKKKRVNGAVIASLVIFAAAVLVGAGTLYLYAVTQPYTQAYLPGTMVMGYPLGGATQEDVQSLLDKIEAEIVDVWQLEISCQHQNYTISAKDVNLAIDREATLAPLWARGHEGGMLSLFADMAALRHEPQAVQPALTYDLAAVDEIFEAVRADVDCEPVNATVTFKPGSAEPFAFTDEEMGYRLELAGIREEIEQHIRSLTPGSLTIEPEMIEPQTYRAVLENATVMRSRMLVQLEGDKAGIANAALAVRALNGKRIDAGKTLSFNKAIGSRSAEKGYLEAAEPAYGADAVGIGGGVCQASTILYRAALLGDIEVVERNTAVRPVSYCPMGQEAAVSEQGLDLVLRNQTQSPLFIMTRTYESDGKTFAELTLIGEVLGKKYALESASRETETLSEPVYVRDREGRYATYSDQHVPVSKALTGYVSVVERVTLDKEGQEIARETISENEYEAVPPMIYVGVMQREK